jgi:hypothetical protein
LDSGNFEKTSLGFFNPLSNRSGNFLRFAVANSNVPVAVANDHKGREAEATTTLDHLRNAVNSNNAL